jgi:hypothetical protein
MAGSLRDAGTRGEIEKLIKIEVSDDVKGDSTKVLTLRRPLGKISRSFCKTVEVVKT